MKKKKRIAVVTGGAGFIGSHMVDLLLKKNFRVNVIDNLSGGRLDNIDQSLNNIKIPFSNFRQKILEVLKKEGYIINFKVDEEKKLKFLSVDLKYYEGQPVIKEIKRVSKPGRRVYSRADSIPKVLNGLGVAILSTSKGVMSDSEAVKNNIGGEIICRIF